MSEAKHTPGPWAVDPNHRFTGYGDVDAVIMAGDQIISTIYGGRELQPHITALPTFEYCRANARLIAAAPDMLDTLKECAAYLGSLPPGGTREPLYLAYSAASDAIARATTPAAHGTQGLQAEVSKP